MEFREILVSAIDALAGNKLRTILATLGIVIGIASVIALVSLGQASQQSIQNSIQSLGSNVLTVTPGAARTGQVRSQGSVETLTTADAQAIEDQLGSTYVGNVAPQYSGRAQIVANGQNTNTQVQGVTSAYQTVRNVQVQTGAFITDDDDLQMRKIAVLGPQVVSDLFGENATSDSVVGQEIRINGTQFTVVGVTVSKGGSGLGNQDDVLYIPLNTAQKQLFGAHYLSTLSVEAKSADLMTDAQTAIGYLLLSRHHLASPEVADFQIVSQSDILSTASSITGTFTTLLSAIAAISLVVGGIGIMNIMLVTVTERTREIGLRKALGAKKKVIVVQFLVEAIVLTVLGGLIGILVGLGVFFVYTQVQSLPFVVSIPSAAMAVGVSGIIGILFGWYPAQKAANLQPIEALRYE